MLKRNKQFILYYIYLAAFIDQNTHLYEIVRHQQLYNTEKNLSPIENSIGDRKI